jgi:acyl-CoA thioester hydrolase
MARHIFHCPLRWGDMDAYGHINNVVYLRYLEEARVDLMFRLGERLEGPRFASGCVVARHEIDYLRPMAHGFGAVTIETWVTRMTAASISLAYEVKDADQVYARAATVLVPYNLAEGRVRRLTESEREFLDAYRDDEPAAGPADAGQAAAGQAGAGQAGAGQAGAGAADGVQNGEGALAV